METTKVFEKNIEAEKRLVINQGGTSSSKTWSILQILLLHAIKRNNLVISVVSETLPHIKRGAMRDFLIMLKQLDLYSPDIHDKTNIAFHFGTSFIEFFGADSEDKVRGPRRDSLFLNECNNISQATFDQLEVRTKETIFLDYNPTHEFWIHELMQYRDDYEYIHSTYLDNDFLDERIKKSIEQRKHNENWWRVYGKGETGHLEGVIYKNWKQVDEFPEEANSQICGLDFGYTNNPSALIRGGILNNELYADELMYQHSMTNGEITQFIKGQDINLTIIADSAEPKSIEEIYQYGIDIRPSEKGPDSVNYGIGLIQDYTLNVTKRSVNLIKELRNYAWDKDKTGKQLNKPIKMFDHGLDGLRYAVMMLHSVPEQQGIVTYDERVQISSI